VKLRGRKENVSETERSVVLIVMNKKEQRLSYCAVDFREAQGGSGGRLKEKRIKRKRKRKNERRCFPFFFLSFPLALSLLPSFSFTL
jgi:hypothetical protein